MNAETELAKVIANAIEKKSARVQTSAIPGEYVGKDAEGKPWVLLPGAESPTPLRRMAVEAAVGDILSVTIANGRAVADSNISNPSAGIAGVKAVDKKATVAQDTAEQAIDYATEAQGAALAAQASAETAAKKADEASLEALNARSSAAEAHEAAVLASDDASLAHQMAVNAIEDASVAHAAADDAQAAAESAQDSADDAQASANQANQFANSALTQLSVIEDVTGTLDWIASHGTYTLTQDSTIQEGKVYFTRSGSGSTQDPYVYIAVPEPDGSDISTYYELSIDSAVSQYVASHLALTNAGLYIIKDNNGYKALFSNSGMTVYDSSGTAVAVYGEGIEFDSDRPLRIGNDDAYIEYYDSDEDGVADSIRIKADTISYGASSSNVESIISQISGDLEDYKDSNDAAVEALQSQVDGQIEAHYYSVDPTSSNQPASSWNTDELKERHRGDIYYNVTNGHSWRWMKDGNTWKWQQIPDSDAAAALAEAQAASTLAGNKRRIFTSTPIAPYDVGDLWVNGSVVKYATQLRTGDGTANGAYHAEDWTLTATDDTAANAAQTTANANIKSTVQLWFTKADDTAPSKPTAHVTTNNVATANAWNIAVPTYNSAYPNYFYCYEYQKGDSSYAWSDVVHDKATTENQANARSALSGLSTKVETSVFNEVKNTVDENSATITTLSTIATNNGLTTSTNITNTVNTVSQTATSNSSVISELTTTLGTNADGTTKTGDIVHRTSAVEQDLSGFHTTVSQTYATKTELSDTASAINPFIIGTQAAATRFWTGTCPELSSLTDGQQITYWLPYAYKSETAQSKGITAEELNPTETVTTASSNDWLKLTLSDGTDTGWVPCYYSGTTRMTSHYAANNAIHLTYRTNIGSIARGWWGDANYDSGTNYTKYSDTVKAGLNGVKRYTLCMKDENGAITSIVNQANNKNATGKTAYTGGLKLEGVFYASTGSDYAANANTGAIWESYGSIDFRYSTNGVTDAAETTTLQLRKPVYLVGTINSSGLFVLDSSQWWTQTEPTTADGKVYVLVGSAYSSYYQIYLAAHNLAYVYVDGKFQEFALSRISRAETAIEQTSQQITLKADASDVYTKTAVDGLINTEVANRNAAITTKAGEITASVAETYETISNVSSLAGRVSTAESNITANANNIALKVSESDVTGNYLVGKINLDATTATIAASKVNIAGAALFTSGRLSQSSLDSTYDAAGSAATAKAEAIAEIPTDLSDLNNDAGFITSSDVPTNISDLTNDTGFITSSDVPTNISDLTNDTGFITSSDVPTKVSDLTNDSGFATTTEAQGYAATAISTAAADATTKANAAQAAAISTAAADATTKANAAQAAAISEAAEDASGKADAAKEYADEMGEKITGSFTEAIEKTAFDAQQKAEELATSALDDAQAYVDNFMQQAVFRSQLVYFQAESGTAVISDTSPLETWISESDESSYGTPHWSTKRPTYNSQRPVLFVSVQSQTVSQSDTNACSFTAPMIDDTTTIIDGGSIITNSITSEQINVDELRAYMLEVSNLLIGERENAHMEAVGNRLSFMVGETEVAYVAIDVESGESVFYMTKAIIVQDLRFASWQWKSRGNRNLSLKWIGGGA